MNQVLMIQVERVVREIPASHSRKMRIREELYALLSDRVDELVARGLSLPTAIQHALATFGEPGELRSEIEATVPGLERFSATLDQFLIGRAAPAMWARPVSVREALRAGFVLGLVLLSLLFFIVAVLGWGFGNWKGLVIWKAYFALAGVFAWNAAVMIWCGSRAVQRLISVSHWQNGLPDLMAWAVSAGVCFGLSVGLLYLGAGWHAFADVGWYSSLWAGPTGATVFAVVCGMVTIEVKQRLPWISLELETD